MIPIVLKINVRIRSTSGILQIKGESRALLNHFTGEIGDTQYPLHDAKRRQELKFFYERSLLFLSLFLHFSLVLIHRLIALLLARERERGGGKSVNERSTLS